MRRGGVRQSLTIMGQLVVDAICMYVCALGTLERKGGMVDIHFLANRVRQASLTGQRLECTLKIATGVGKKFLKGGWDSWGSTLHIHSGNGMRMVGNEIILSDRRGGGGRKHWQTRVLRKCLQNSSV